MTTTAPPFAVDLTAWPGVAVHVAADGTITASNGRLERALGRPVVGQPLTTLLDAESSHAKWARLAAPDARPGQPCELIFVTDGRLAEPMACSLLAAADGRWLVEHPTPARLDALAREVVEVNAELTTTQRDLVMERSRLARALAELERSNRALDEFAHVVSHDLKAPLRAIRDSADALLDEELPNDERLARLRRVRDLGARMRAMIDAALAYARAGRTPERLEPVSLAALVPDIVAFLAPPDAVRIDIAPDLPTIVTERVPLEQVLRNLIANAIVYRRADDARVTISAREGRDDWELVVADNGPGIPSSQLERIWRLFQTSRPDEGTGLGLALVKRLVESHGGTVRVESAEGAGATFHVHWPKRPMRPFSPSAARAAGTPPRP